VVYVPESADPKTLRIAALNDDLRRTLCGGEVLLTAGVNVSPHRDRIVEAVRSYDFSAGDPGDDPYQERDFGAFDVGGERYFWKIDYYDTQLEMLSPDPSDPAVTRRVLTIMTADEY
jgi:hypothetical protein